MRYLLSLFLLQIVVLPASGQGKLPVPQKEVPQKDGVVIPIKVNPGGKAVCVIDKKKLVVQVKKQNEVAGNIQVYAKNQKVGRKITIRNQEQQLTYSMLKGPLTLVLRHTMSNKKDTLRANVFLQGTNQSFSLNCLVTAGNNDTIVVSNK